MKEYLSKIQPKHYGIISAILAMIGIYIILLICWILVDQSIDYTTILIYRTFEDAVAFTKVLRNIYDRHSGVSFLSQ